MAKKNQEVVIRRGKRRGWHWKGFSWDARNVLFPDLGGGGHTYVYFLNNILR